MPDALLILRTARGSLSDALASRLRTFPLAVTAYTEAIERQIDASAAAKPAEPEPIRIIARRRKIDGREDGEDEHRILWLPDGRVLWASDHESVEGDTGWTKKITPYASTTARVTVPVGTVVLAFDKSYRRGRQVGDTGVAAGEVTPSGVAWGLPTRPGGDATEVRVGKKWIAMEPGAHVPRSASTPSKLSRFVSPAEGRPPEPEIETVPWFVEQVRQAAANPSKAAYEKASKEYTARLYGELGDRKRAIRQVHEQLVTLGPVVLKAALNAPDFPMSSEGNRKRTAFRKAHRPLYDAIRDALTEYTGRAIWMRKDHLRRADGSDRNIAKGTRVVTIRQRQAYGGKQSEIPDGLEGVAEESGRGSSAAKAAIGTTAAWLVRLPPARTWGDAPTEAPERPIQPGTTSDPASLFGLSWTKPIKWTIEGMDARGNVRVRRWTPPELPDVVVIDDQDSPPEPGKRYGIFYVVQGVRGFYSASVRDRRVLTIATAYKTLREVKAFLRELWEARRKDTADRIRKAGEPSPTQAAPGVLTIRLGGNQAGLWQMEVMDRYSPEGGGELEGEEGTHAFVESITDWPDDPQTEPVYLRIPKTAEALRRVLDLVTDAANVIDDQIENAGNLSAFERETRGPSPDDLRELRALRKAGETLGNRITKALRACEPKRNPADYGGNVRIPKPQPPGPWVTPTENLVTGEKYADYRATDPACTFAEGAQIVHDANVAAAGGKGGKGSADAGGGFRSRGPILWAMRVCKLSQWYRDAHADGERWNHAKNRPYTDAELKRLKPELWEAIQRRERGEDDAVQAAIRDFMVETGTDPLVDEGYEMDLADYLEDRGLPVPDDMIPF